MFLASAWMTSTFVSPCSATSSRAMAKWTGSTSSPTTRPRGADALGEQLEDSTWAASDVDRALSLSAADSVPSVGGQGLEFGGLSPQPLSFGGVSPQRIRHRRRRIRRTAAFIDAHARPPVDVQQSSHRFAVSVEPRSSSNGSNEGSIRSKPPRPARQVWSLRDGVGADSSARTAALEEIG